MRAYYYPALAEYAFHRSACDNLYLMLLLGTFHYNNVLDCARPIFLCEYRVLRHSNTSTSRVLKISSTSRLHQNWYSSTSTPSLMTTVWFLLAIKYSIEYGTIRSHKLGVLLSQLHSSGFISPSCITSK